MEKFAPPQASKENPLSQRQYAAWRKKRGLPGGSHVAVSNAVKAGRLSGSVDADGQIVDIERADREWAANTDLTKAPASVVAMSGVGRSSGATPPPTADTEGVMLLPDANAAKATWQARTAKLEYLKAAGDLVEAKTVLRAIQDMVHRSRTKLLGIPSRAKQAMPELTTAQIAKFEDLIRESLEDLAAEGVP